MPEAPNWLFVINVCGWILTTLLSLIISLLKMENNRQERRIKQLEDDYRELNNLIRSEYLDKDDTKEMWRQVKEEMAVMNAKLDAVLMEGRKL